MPPPSKWHHWTKSPAAKRAEKVKATETPEQREARRARVQANARRKRDSETPLQREERLASKRLIHAKRKKSERKETREKRIEIKRIQTAARKAKKQQELDRAMRLVQTESTFETNVTRQIRDQVHQIYTKITRLSVTSVRHVHIAPDSTDGTQSESLWENHMPLFSCPMEEEIKGRDGSQFESKVVVSEIDYPNPASMVQVKYEPMTSECDESNMVVGDSNPAQDPVCVTVKSEPMIGQPDTAEMITDDVEPDCEVITGAIIDPNSELITSDVRPNPQPMISETDTVGGDRVITDTLVKCEVYTEEL